jgi:hypothetical protein
VTTRQQGRQPQYSGPWRRIRLRVLQRDGYLCQVRLPGCTITADEADHITPTSQGGAWFDLQNLRGSCKHCNLARKGQHKDDGWRHAPTRINLVVGPPGAGKSAYVAEHARPGHLVIDYDAIASALGAGGAASPHGGTMVARNALLKSLQQGKLDAPVVWLISANPKAEQMFPHHRVIMVDSGTDATEKADLSLDDERRHGLAKRWHAARAATSETAARPSRDW